MNKVELIAEVASKTGFTKKDVTETVETTLEAIMEALVNGDSVKLVGFGNFEARETAARKGRNPQTGAELEIAASKKPTFKAGKPFKDRVKP